jgi:hypothetical protein
MELETNTKIILQLYKECSDALNNLNEKQNNSNLKLNIPIIKLVKIPKGNIRTITQLEKSYKLDDIIDNENLIKNLYYSMQYLEYLIYVNKTFAIFFGIRTLFFKYAIIHVYSIYEGMLIGVYENLSKDCFNCKKHADCNYFIPKPKNMTFKKIEELAKNKLSLDLEFLQIFKKIKNTRDFVHIHIVNQSEHENNEYEKLLEKGYLGLKILKNELNYKVKDFKKSRKCYCFI